MVNHPIARGISAAILINNKPAEKHPDPENPHVRADEKDSEHLFKFLKNYHDDPAIARDICAVTKQVYIEATPGETFSIRLAVEPPFKLGTTAKLGFVVYVDGEKVVDTKCARKRMKGSKNSWEFVLEGIMKGKGLAAKANPFQFAEIRTSKCIWEECGSSSTLEAD